MQSVTFHKKQKGAVIVTVALVLMFLLGFMGIALDFGRMFIVKTELQTAVDSCALAAAQELDGQLTAIARAQSAGLAAGNINNVNMQSTTWSGQGKLVISSFTFRDAGYTTPTSAANARYAECAHTQPNIQMFLLHILGAFLGNPTELPRQQSVGAFAVATRGSAQTTCPVPVALRPKTAGGVAPNYGYFAGEWITLINAPGGGSTNGQIGWANLDGSNNASETQAELNGFCGTTIGSTLGTPGVQATVADVWNGRFGIYKNTSSPSQNNPDFTGYAYTAVNWPAGQNAYNGVPGTGAPASAQNFVAKRAAFASCADTGTRVKGQNSCESITGLSLNGGFQNPLAAPGNASGGHKDFGRNRRIVTVSVINGASSVIGFACMLMLQPLSIPMANARLEFIGNAGALNSPCATSGLPGGTAGPLVPVLVR